MTYRKVLVWEGGLKSLNKILNNRYNCEYKFKCLFIKEIWTDLYMRGYQLVY